jgi:hypothetical protein
MVLEPLEATNPDVTVDDVEALIDTNYAGKLKPVVEAAIKAKWGKIMGPDVEIVVNYSSLLHAIHLIARTKEYCFCVVCVRCNKYPLLLLNSCLSSTVLMDKQFLRFTSACR